MSEASYAIIPGGGGAGLIWSQIAEELGAIVLRAPDELDIRAMAAGLETALSELPRPRVLIGASMGAMIALELARRIEIDALVLIAAGWGIEVSDKLLGWMERNPPGILEKFSKICLSDPDDPAKVAALVADYEAGGHERHIRQVKAMSAYDPQPLTEPPPTLVLWGVNDSAVPLEDHVRLALECRGALVPIADAGHVPFFEQPAATLPWLRLAGSLAGTTSAPARG
jgi:pimeloyl-ACP methyl ester carboxylesterase